MKTYRCLLALAAAIATTSCNNHSLKHDASGVFEVTEIVVSAQTSGELLRFDLEEGKTLSVNEVVGCIDTIQLALKKEQLEANIIASESSKQNVATQIAALEEQIATQHREQKRYDNLVRSDAANQKQLDDINANLALLKRQVAAQKETLLNSNQRAAADILSLTAQIKQINDQLQKSIIKSPIAGIVLAKYAEESELCATGRALFKIADTSTMKLRAYITADQLNSITLGEAVKVYADQGTESYKEYAGEIIWIADKAEFTPKTIQTRDERANLVYAIKIAVKNDGYIKKGMYGEVNFK